jgi:hypothetical protein
MNIIDRIKKLMGATMLLSFLSLTASPIISYLGIKESAVLEAPEVVQYALVVSFAVTLILFFGALGLGYLMLTGWTGYRAMPLVFRLVLSFALGVIATMFSGPLSILLPVPLIPTLVIALLIWGCFRAVSSHLKSDKMERIAFSDAYTLAQGHVRNLDPRIESLELLESEYENLDWRVVMKALPIDTTYEVKIDGEGGGVSQWRVI